ncbi:XRE family transcriptional regulator [Brevibacillus laterosporus]|nr:XRE family transcriptional regulator [Brevibacillus laterosporus]
MEQVIIKVGLAMKASTLLYTTLGEYIRNKRLSMGMSLSELSRKTGISKGVLSKIEVSETKHPLLRTIKSISEVLYIPKDQIIDIYIRDEKNPNVIQEFLEDAVSINNLHLLQKVALKFLSSPMEDSYTLMEKLFDITSAITDIPSKCILYSTIIQYARERGMQEYLAKSLLHLYLIERDDFTRLESTYVSGKYLLYYENFLSKEDRVLAYFKLGSHAFNLRKYKDSIDFCKHVLKEANPNDQLIVYAVVAIYNSYFQLGDYKEARHYLKIFSTLTQESKINRQDELEVFGALLESKEGNIDLATKKLEECLKRVTDHHYLDVVNGLFEILEKGDLKAIEKLVEAEGKIKKIEIVSPYKGAGVGLFYKMKGDFYAQRGLYAEACNSYTDSITAYNNIGAYDKKFDGLIKIMTIIINHYAVEGIGNTLSSKIEACASVQDKISKNGG